MAVRRESVVLDLDDRLTPGLVRAAAAAALLDRELNKVGGTSVGASRETSAAEQEVKKLGNTAEHSGNQINQFSGRLGLLIDAAVVLGPSLIPIGAEAVPAISGLAAAFASAGAGAITAKLAFEGVGTALKAFNKASLAPTAANITAAHVAMDKLPKSAQGFVLELHKLGPEVLKLREAAGTGLFPGITQGLHTLQRDTPIARRDLHSIGLELGSLAEKAGKSLTSDTWRPFLRFVGTEAPVELDALGRSAGSVAHGFAELWMAFTPLNRGFDDGLVRLTADFDKWATSLGKTKGFENFVAYIQANGPRVIDTLGTLGKTLVDLAVAIAPIGTVSLDVLRQIFEVIDLIANSDFGTPLLAGIVVWRLYARAAQLAGVQVETSFRGMAAAPAQVGLGLTKLQARTTAYARATVADLATVRKAYLLNREFTAGEAAAFTASSGRLRSQMANIGKAGIIAGGVALVASGAADKIGLANTASLGLLGTLGGPLGIAAGVAVGGLIDYKHAADEAGKAQRDLSRVMGDSATSYTDLTAALAAATAQQKAVFDEFGSKQGDFLGSLGATLSDPMGAINFDISGLQGQQAAQAAQIHAAIAAQSANQQALIQLGTKLGAPNLQPKGGAVAFAPNTADGIAQLTALATRAQPAMTALGISLERLANEPPAIRESDIAAITRWTNNADTAQGHTKEVAKAFAAMGDATLTTADRVAALSTSLDALFGPLVGVSAAYDAFHQGLNALNTALAKNSKTLLGNGDAALQNRTAIRDQVTSISDLIKAQANANVPAAKLTENFKRQRKALVDAGVAAGLSREQLNKYLDRLGLTPKLVKTAIGLTGMTKAERELARLTRDRTIHVGLRVDQLGTEVTSGQGGHLMGNGSADGGTIGGAPRHPYGDKVMRWVAPGEEVISNRHGQADQHRALLKAINSRRYAGGGTVTDGRGPRSTSGSSYGQIDYTRLATAMSAIRPPAPLYGDVTVNGGGEAFYRQLQQDRASASLSGVRR